MKKILILIALMAACLPCLFAQDSIQYRIILIGDAGQITHLQRSIINDAVRQSLPVKTIALFLGDNVYPKGIEIEEGKRKSSENILRSQYADFRKNGVPVYFIPGNHDWDKSGPRGYEKIKAANTFLRLQQDSLLKMIPEDGCPGPYELSVNENLVVIAMDSEWWLYPYERNINDDCECKTKRELLGRLEDILRRNKNKVVIFAIHHPFKSYGVHGGYYTFKDHFFPLTNKSKNFYIPLPVVGSLYPLLRKTFPPAEDLNNVLYKDMKRSIGAIIQQYPNVILVSGHEHSLQLINGENLQVVSGAGSRYDHVKKGKESIYAKASGGYIIADVLKNNDVKLSFFAFGNNGLQQNFVYNKSYKHCIDSMAFDFVTTEADSIKISLKKDYEKVNNLHRNLFGENYRKIWAMESTIPVLHVSKAGLQPVEIGGGMQTHSLRLKDTSGNDWVIRSLDKFPDALLPKALSQTLASDILQDNFSAIFPYAPLTVPVIANALGVPHAKPSIVYIAADKTLGIYSRDFANSIALLEEREPFGKSYSTIKMQEKLVEDNDNSVNQHLFLTARIQDIFLGDWDRHGDQWRWVATENEKGKLFRALPRDRDQVFYVNQGLFPKIASLPWIEPKLQGFGASIRNVNTFSFNARFIDGLYTNALSHEDWLTATNNAVKALSDSVIDAALKKMPSTVYLYAHNKLFKQLQSRRKALLRVMPIYYRFLNKTIDIVTSDKNELVFINDTLNGKMNVSIYKITKEKEKEKLIYQRIMEPSVTREIRLYVNGGADNVFISNSNSPITIRIVGDATSKKQYHVVGKSKYLRKIHVYGGTTNTIISGQSSYIHRHLSNDNNNAAMQLTDRYNKKIPLLKIGYNMDDGLILGGGLRWINKGFRKQPYASIQEISLAHSFSTNAYKAFYEGEWLHIFRNTDFILKATAAAPDNTQNFYGRGNKSVFDKTDSYKTYYRTRFDYFTINPAFRWRSVKNKSFSIGPSYQSYHYDPDDNLNRFITKTSLLHSYDSATISKDKSHLGIVANFTFDSRSSLIMPKFGSYINVQLLNYLGLNNYSKSYTQLIAQMAFYKSIGRKSGMIVTNRTGGGITAGSTTFYQSLFLGGQSNLQGYSQYRYAGDHMLYNNTEVRIKLANFASYILPGQLGFVGFYDIGKVWQKGYNNSGWHSGTGGGLYFSPAQLFVFQFVVGKSDEGWYPYLTAGFRF